MKETWRDALLIKKYRQVLKESSMDGSFFIFFSELLIIISR